MTKFPMALSAFALSAAAAFAQDAAMAGDPAAGEQAFRQCVTCHVIEDAEGNAIAGRNAMTGPNLYGVIGRQAGTVEDYRYSGAMVEAGEQGLVWDQDSFVAYVQDPSGFLKEFLDDSGARGKMAYRVRSEEDALDFHAYLASVGPEMDAEAATE